MTNRDPLLLFLVFSAYLALGIIGITKHELSLDEAHHWLLARDSHSLSELLYHTRYEGHPLLWYTLLALLSLFSKSIFVLQGLHLFIAALAAFLFLKHAPFSWIQKTLIVFSYWFFFEYSLVSRNYSLGWLFLVALCILFTQKKRNDLLIAVVLFLLANSHFFSLICSIPFFLLLIYERNREKAPVLRTLLLALIYLAGLAITAYQIAPPEDSFISANSVPKDFGIVSGQRFGRFFAFFTKSLFCIPDFTVYNFRNTQLLFVHFKPAAYLVSAISLALPFLCFRKKLSFLIFYSATLGIAASLYILPMNDLHYHGFCFMLFLACLWLDKKYKGQEVAYSTIRIQKIGAFLFWCMLIVQAFSGFTAYSRDYRFPFSEGKNVAAYILADPSYNRANLIALNAGPPVAAYLDRMIYYPEEDRYSTFCTWNLAYLRDLNAISNNLKKELGLMSEEKTFIMIAYRSGQSDLLQAAIEKVIPKDFKVKNFGNSMIRGENYTLLEFENKK